MSSAKSTTASREVILDYEAEARDLKATIAALREALEQEQSLSTRRIAQALLATDSEIAQLKNTAIALRETLEQAGRQKEQAVQAAVVELRDQMELMRHEKEAAVQAIVLRTHNEISQLKDIAAALRSQLEEKRPIGAEKT